ncbi:MULTISPECIES: hypothetical protein [Kitasatospora]|uniref:hypothetical protein n=2 Tax=Streptomycetaceae TaxID=2062 RepID=UPI001EEA3EDD|nr:hypothetical protein [Kitasatospora sp. A2-31]MCG6496926.1 hypothetical protein [Kitasatospora sp. A2-31]
MLALLRTGGAAQGRPAAHHPAVLDRMSEGTRHAVTDSLRRVAPDADVVRISVSEPHGLWLARAYDRAHMPVGLPLAVEEAVAHWVARDLPSLDWRHQHDVDLATGTVVPAGALAKAA